METKNSTSLKVGEKMTFLQLIRENPIEIPTIQRDYTYGCGLEKTDDILFKLLDAFRNALETGEELTLDFIYGDVDPKKNFIPLDGQQRLTTLLLLHYFAALKDGGDKSELSGFSYSTRTTTRKFCKKLFDEFTYNPSAVNPALGTPESISTQIRKFPFFLPSFEDDPSIRSMLYVLDRIEERFSDMDGLYEKLCGEDCPICFYKISFTKFYLSDDLYIKMNSRGKQLTLFEIFKATFEKHLEEKFGKEVKDQVARKLDVEWCDLVWNECGRNVKAIDDAFLRLFHNLFILLTVRHGNNPDKLGAVQKIYDACVVSKDDVNFIISFMDVFHSIYKQYGSIQSFWDVFIYVGGNNAVTSDDDRIRYFGATQGNIFRDALSTALNPRYYLFLYAFYYGLTINKDFPEGLDSEFARGLRHLRNLIENGIGDDIKADSMPDLFDDTERIMEGKIGELAGLREEKMVSLAKGFNAPRMVEEVEKSKDNTRWSELFRYENHNLLRGSLRLFSPSGAFDITDDEVFTFAKDTLERFSGIFDDKSANPDVDWKIRSALLTLGDYSQSPVNEPKKKYLGHIHLSWRNLFVASRVRAGQEKIINIIHSIGLPFDIDAAISGFTDTSDWRYYFIKYRGSMNRCYGADRFGYFYLADESRPMEFLMLQSTQESANNVEYKILNAALADQYDDWDNLFLGWHGNDMKIRIFNSTIDSVQEGWAVTSREDGLIPYLNSQGFPVADGICPVPEGTDRVEFGLTILQAMKDYTESLPDLAAEESTSPESDEISN